jgi:phosphate transport system substrate-binding protein
MLLSWSNLGAVAALGFLCGLSPPPAPAAEPGLTYAGAATISMSVLYQGALKGFEKKTGIIFSRIDTASGTGRGLDMLAEGKVTLAGSARPLTGVETRKGLVGTTIGYDALALWVNKANMVKGLTRDQLRRIYRGEIRNWKLVGGEDLPIMVFIEPPDSRKATLSMIQETIMGMTPYPSFHSVVEYPRDGMVATASADGGLTAASLGLLSTLSPHLCERLRPLAVDGVTPSPAVARGSDYLLNRPLLLVTRGPATGKEKQFIDYILSPEGQAIVARSFVPIDRQGKATP